MKATFRFVLLFAIIYVVGCGKKDDIPNPPPAAVDSTQLATSLKIIYNNSRYDSALSTYTHDDLKRITRIISQNFYAPSRGGSITFRYLNTITYYYNGSDKQPTTSLLISTAPGFVDSIITSYYFNFEKKLIQDSTNERVYDNGRVAKYITNSYYTYSGEKVMKRLVYKDLLLFGQPTFVNYDTMSVSSTGNVLNNKYYHQSNNISGSVNYSYNNNRNPLSANNLISVNLGFRRTYHDIEDNVSFNGVTELTSNYISNNQSFPEKNLRADGVDIARADGFLLETKLKSTLSDNTFYMWKYVYKKL